MRPIATSREAVLKTDGGGIRFEMTGVDSLEGSERLRILAEAGRGVGRVEEAAEAAEG